MCRGLAEACKCTWWRDMHNSRRSLSSFAPAILQEQLGCYYSGCHPWPQGAALGELSENNNKFEVLSTRTSMRRENQCLAWELEMMDITPARK